MSIFLRSLPQTIQLNPADSQQFTTVFDNHECHTLYFQWKVKMFSEKNYQFPEPAHRYSNWKMFGDDTNNMDVHLKFISDSFGLLLVSSFFNTVYKLHPKLAITSIEQSIYFNYRFRGLFIIQALNRLAYAYFGLDYEKYRNKKDIKSRSVIEDFHSILGHILVLPEKTLKNEGIVWHDMSVDHSQYPFYTHVYDDMFIDQINFIYHTTSIYQFSFLDHTILAPFFTEEKSKLYSSYGEFRALRNPNDNSTYLYKTFIAQPQNCEYEEVEKEKMGIESKFNYNDIGLEYNPYSNWEDNLDKNDSKFYDNIHHHIPPLNQLSNSIKDTNNLHSDLLGVFSYPKELLELWINTAKNLQPCIKENPTSLNFENNFKLEYEDNHDLAFLTTLDKKIVNALKYLIKIHKGFRDKENIDYGQASNEAEAFANKIILDREIEASRYIQDMIYYLANLGVLKPECK